ncbi:MAG: GGDEF domain-containing protein [Lachnospiraceae bacterium]
MRPESIATPIISEMEDIVYISDPNTYELYYINPSLQEKLGNPPEEEWHRKKCYRVLQGLDSPCPFCTNHLLCHEHFYNWEYYNKVLDSHFFIQDKLVNFDGIEARLEFAKDIGDVVSLKDSLNKQLADQQVLNNCISLLHTPESPDTSINKLLGLVAQYYDAERGYIFLNSADQLTIDNSHEWCAEGVIPQIELLQNVDIEIVGHWYKKYEQVGEFFIDSLHDDLDHDSEEYKILAMQEVYSLATAPLYNTDGSFMGFIGVDNPKEHLKEATIIRAVSSFVADFIDKNRQLDALYQASYFDTLTGMRNRNSYSKMIADLRKNPPARLGVVYVDINGLKAVNDIYGHSEGDNYIKEVGIFLRDLYDDCAFRIGGDEFVMLCPEREPDCYQNKISQLYDFVSADGYPKAAIGYCWNETNPNVIEQIEIADHMMYTAKEEQYKEFATKNEIFKTKAFVSK